MTIFSCNKLVLGPRSSIAGRIGSNAQSSRQSRHWFVEVDFAKKGALGDPIIQMIVLFDPSVYFFAAKGISQLFELLLEVSAQDTTNLQYRMDQLHLTGYLWCWSSRVLKASRDRFMIYASDCPQRMPFEADKSHLNQIEARTFSVE